ncbi:MAG: hypothetical protein ACE141_16300 [Bryobacteraceae bacterium]
MRAFAVLVAFFASVIHVSAQDAVREAIRLEDAGDAARAEQLLRAAVSRRDAGPAVLEAYAGFLERHGSPGARAAYERLLESLEGPDQRTRRAGVARKLVLLALEAGDRTAALGHLRHYRELGGTGWDRNTLERPQSSPEPGVTTPIPGPLVSFKRMAAISADVTESGILPALARNVVVSGYQAGSGKEGLVPTEYLKLLVRYVSQARELEKLAGPAQEIRVETCDSTQTADLLRTLGYRMRGACGTEVVLETVNASRAFLTIDSGFPLAELEQALRTNRPFVYDYRPSRVAVAATTEYWQAPRAKQTGDLIDAFLADPSLCRLYLALSKPDPETAAELRKSIPMDRLKAFAHVLDFFGSMFEIREGRAVVPGGARTSRMWEDLVGVSPDQGARFFERLISRDDGWMASYFDALARLNGPVKDYLTEPERMRRFYLAIRGRVTSPGPARPVFQSNTDMLLLTTRLRLEPDGRPHVPGGLEVWKRLFTEQPEGRYDERLSRQAPSWKGPDDVLEALFALCRKSIENEPLKIFMTLSDLNRGRAQPLAPATVDRLARAYRRYGAQYPVFSEVPSISDAVILRFLDTAGVIDGIGNQALRSDALGTFQALVGLWQIFCRQHSIPAAEADAALGGILSSFEKVRSATDVFNAGRSGVTTLLKATGGAVGAQPQERLMNLLAGSGPPETAELREAAAAEMRGYFDAQRLVPLSLLFEVADHADSLAKGEKLNTALIGRLTAMFNNIDSPRSPLSSAEKNSMQSGYWPERHIEVQRRLNLRSLLEKAGRDPARLQEIRGQLAPALRDTLVGLNYIYYAPPAAELLRSSSSFVRSHDFLGMSGSRESWRTTAPYGSGWPMGAGGRLIGSLAALPYALAQAEQNFLVPDREQALIWGDLVPQLILSAKVPRWWNVTPAQMHWVALHIHCSASLVAESVMDAGVRAEVEQVISLQAAPARVYRFSRLLDHGDAAGALEELTPSEQFLLAKEMLTRRPEPAEGIAARIRQMAASAPGQIDYAAVSRAFGTPKPTLTASYRPELLSLRTFPTLMGYSSRILAESWESNTLYWAVLADEIRMPPAQLNLSVPEWTRLAVQRIFASHLEDWPAVLSSLRHVGAEVRRAARSAAEGDQKASLE